MKVELLVKGGDSLVFDWEKASDRVMRIGDALLQAATVMIRNEAKKTLLDVSRKAEARRAKIDKAMAETYGEKYRPQKRSSRDSLAGTLWEKKVRSRSKRIIQYRVGWGMRHGPILEWGPMQCKSGWMISPGKTSKFLRWYSFKLKRVFKSYSPVWHPWDESQKRPHFAPAYDKVWPGFIQKLEKVFIKAI